MLTHELDGDLDRDPLLSTFTPYVGDLESRSGAGVARGVRRRLAEAGFERVVDKKRAFGLIAYKQ